MRYEIQRAESSGTLLHSPRGHAVRDVALVAAALILVLAFVAYAIPL